MRLKLHMLASFLLAMTLIVLATVYSEKPEEAYTPVPFLQSKHRWADSLIRKMDRSEKIGQLLMVVAEPDSSEQDSLLTSFIRKYKPGGIAFKGYNVNQQWKRTKIYQTVSENPLLIGMFPSQGSEEFLQIPDNLSLMALHNDSLINDLGIGLAQQSLALGVNLYFLPTFYSDQSPENRALIATRISMIGQRLQEQRIMAVPTEVYPYFPYERDSAKINSLLASYRKYSKSGTSGFVIKEEVIDRIKLNSQKPLIVRNYLENQINYKGLIIGQINPEGDDISEQVKKMMKAGVDLIILQKDQIAQTKSVIHNLMVRKDLTGPELNEKAKRVLLAKTWSRTRTTYAEALTKDTFEIDVPKHRLINHSLKKEAMTLVNNQANQIPFTDLQKKLFHVVTIGKETGDLLNQMRFYTELSNSRMERKKTGDLPRLNVRNLRRFEPVILVFNQELPDSTLDQEFYQSLSELQDKTDVIAVHLGEVNNLKQLSAFETLIHSYGNSPTYQTLAAQAIFGGISMNGKLPVPLNDNLWFGQGDFSPVNRLGYTIPEEIGLSSADLSRIDSVVYEGMGGFAMPGAQVLVAKAGKVIYHKAFGYHTYAKKTPVKLTDLYDIASITKVAGTTAATMKMYDQGRMSPDERLGQFFKDQYVFLDSVIQQDTVWIFSDSLLAEVEDTTKEDSPVILVAQREKIGLQVDSFYFGDTLMIVSTQRSKRTKVKSEIFKLKISDLLTHHSGLPAGLPIRPYLRYRNKRVGKYDKFYSPREDSLFSVQVANGYYLRRDYLDSIWKETKKINPGPKYYEYSDANLVLVQMAIDSVNKEPISHYLNRELYEPLGMQNARYTPRESLDDGRLIPTEYDGRWRGQLLRGYVHDPTAALMGGVAGNAGLFSNANDLAILFQMFLNGGEYGGERHLEESTIKMFTQAQTGHRGFGFDKPPQTGGYIIGENASMSSYGHTGFTGTCVWVDPDEELVYVFLSNRVHPRAQNWELNALRIRQRIHDVIYEAIEEAERYN